MRFGFSEDQLQLTAAVRQLLDGELQLVLGKPEPHGQLLGRPSTRSAIRLRWISLVPA